MNSGRKIEVALSPKLYDVYRNDDAIVVMVDIFRASSAICAAFHHGVEQVIPVSSIEEAKVYQQKGYLVGAERKGMVVEGFEFGNSPRSYMTEELKGKTIVLTTTNGTKAINIAKDAYMVVVGAFVNISTLCKWLVEQNRDVLLLCAGWQDRFNLEDTLFSGAVADELANYPDVFSEMGDAALAARYLYQSAKNDPDKFLWNSSHRRRLAHLNLKEDIRYCLQLDETKVLPVVQNGVLVEVAKVTEPVVL